jgi:hypothetical protein
MFNATIVRYIANRNKGNLISWSFAQLNFPVGMCMRLAQVPHPQQGATCTERLIDIIPAIWIPSRGESALFHLWHDINEKNIIILPAS